MTIAPIAVMVLIVAACGSSEGDAVTTTVATTAAPTTTATSVTTQPPTTTTATTNTPTTTTEGVYVGDPPQDIARSFVEARDTWDAERAIALFAPDAVINDLAGTPGGYRDLLAWYEAVGWRVMVDECVVTLTGSTAEVTCTYTHENAWTRALSVGPFSGSSYRFTIANGQIQELDHTFDASRFSTQAWDVFYRWVRDNHPEDIDQMYEVAGSVPRITPASNALWELYTNEFVAP